MYQYQTALVLNTKAMVKQAAAQANQDLGELDASKTAAICQACDDPLHGMLILKNACLSLASRCISGITANREICRRYVQNSIGLVTALNPVLGYEKSAAIAKEALKTGASVYDLVLEKGWLTRVQLDDLLRPENMTDPRKVPR